MARKKKITAFVARMIIFYNYGSSAIEDPDWVDEMVDSMLATGKRADDICKEHNWVYPPRTFWDHQNYVSKGNVYRQKSQKALQRKFI